MMNNSANENGPIGNNEIQARSANPMASSQDPNQHGENPSQSKGQNPVQQATLQMISRQSQNQIKQSKKVIQSQRSQQKSSDVQGLIIDQPVKQSNYGLSQTSMVGNGGGNSYLQNFKQSQKRQIRTENSPVTNTLGNQNPIGQQVRQKGINIKRQNGGANSGGRQALSSDNKQNGIVATQANGYQHQKVVTATFNNDFIDKLAQQNEHPNNVSDAASAAQNKQQRANDGQQQNVREKILSRNQKQTNGNQKRIMGHALTSHPYMNGQMMGKKMQLSSPLANLGGTAQNNQYMHKNFHNSSTNVDQNFPAINQNVRSSYNNPQTSSQGNPKIGANVDILSDHKNRSKGVLVNYNQPAAQPLISSNRQSRMVNQNNNQQQVTSQTRPNEQAYPSNHQNTQPNIDNQRVYSGGSQNPKAAKTNHMPIQRNLGITGITANRIVNANAAPTGTGSSHQSRSTNDRKNITDGNIKDKQFTGTDIEAINKYYQNKNTLQSHELRENTQNIQNNKSNLHNNGGNTLGGGTSIRSTKSGRSTRSNRSNNLNRNQSQNQANIPHNNNNSKFEDSSIEKQRDSSSPRPVGNYLNSMGQQNPNQQALTRSAKIKEQVKVMKQQNNNLSNIFNNPLRSSKQRNNNDNLEANYFSDRTSIRPSSSRLEGSHQNGKYGTSGNLKESLNNQVDNQPVQNSANFPKQNILPDSNNMYQLKNNGQNMILNKYLSNQSNNKTNQANSKSGLISKPNNPQPSALRSISQKSNRIESAKTKKQQYTEESDKQNNKFNYKATPSAYASEQPQESQAKTPHGNQDLHSPSKSRQVKDNKGITIRGTTSTSGVGTFGKTSMSPLSIAAKNQLSTTNMDYSYNNDKKSSNERVQSSKYRNNALTSKNPQKKSRNAEIGAALMGMSTTEQAFFNSNREKSPEAIRNPQSIDGGASTASYSGQSTDAFGSGSALSLGAADSGRRVPMNQPVNLGNTTIQQQQSGLLAPSTGETQDQVTDRQGPSRTQNPNRNENLETEGSNAPQNPSTVRIEASQHQKTLPNKFGEFDKVIIEVERENQSLYLKSKNGNNPIENILEAQYKNLLQQDNVNPLKDFEDAKYASKSHGLITSYSANTHQGIQRNYNEDRVSIILNMTRPEGKDPNNWPKCSFFAIYDGHGGSSCADYLKDHLHQIIITQPCFPDEPKKALRDGCRIAEERFLKIADQGGPRSDKSGSCAIIILTVETECYVANVGDSRAVMSSANGMRVYELSQDHRPNEEAEFYRIQDNGGQVYQTQTFQNIPVTDSYGRVTGTQRQMLFGPYRVLPGRLSVSRTFGDIEAKQEKYGGKPGVVIAEPEISQFTIDEQTNDFIVLGCDGIYDRLTSMDVVDAAWSAMAQTLKAQQKLENQSRKQLDIHKISGKMADQILKSSAIERSFDNLTIVMIVFKNLQNFHDSARKKQQKQIQAIKIEGESTNQTPQLGNFPKMNASIASRNRNKEMDNQDGILPNKLQNLNDQKINQGYHTTKLQKTKDPFSKKEMHQSEQSNEQNYIQTDYLKQQLSQQDNQSYRSKLNPKASDAADMNKRASNSTQNDRESSKNRTQNQPSSSNQNELLERKKSSDYALRASQNSQNQRNSNSTNAAAKSGSQLHGAAQNKSIQDMSNKYMSRESRNKRRAAIGQKGGTNNPNDAGEDSRFGQMYNRDEMMYRGAHGGLQGYDTHNNFSGIGASMIPDAAARAHQSRNLNDGSKANSQGDSTPGQHNASLDLAQKSTSKDHHVQNAKMQNKLMLEQQKKYESQFKY